MNYIKALLPQILIAALAGIAAIFVAFYTLKYNAAFDTDAADHANAALEVYHALKSISITNIAESIFMQSFYPPIHSVVTAFFYFITGPGVLGSILPSIAGFWLSAVLITFLTKKLHYNSQHDIYSIFSSMLPGILLITAPVNFFNAGLCMMEQVSLTLFIITLFLISNLNSNSNKATIFLIALTLSLTALSKYTVMAAILPPALIAMIYALKVGIIDSKKFILGTALLLSILIIWFTNIQFSSVTDFILKQPPLKDGFWSQKNFFYYPKSFFNAQVANPVAGILVLLFALGGAISLRKKTIGVFCISVFVWSLIIFTITSEKGGRHILFLMPAIFLLIPAGLERIKSIPLRSTLLLVIYLLIAFGSFHDLKNYKKNFARKFESPSNSSEVIKFIASSTSNGSAVLTHGLNDSLSLEGLRLQTALTKDSRYRDVKVDSFPFHRATRDLAISHQRNLALPWQNHAIPAKPLLKVLQSGAYDFYVTISTPNYLSYKAKHLQSEAGDKLNDFLKDKRIFVKKFSKQLPSVEVYDLRNIVSSLPQR